MTEPEPKDGGSFVCPAAEKVNDSVARSEFAVFPSQSCAMTVTVPPVAAVGVPQTVRGSVPAQPFTSTPEESSLRPVGSPVAV